MLEEKIWDLDFEGSSNIIDVYIRRLRKKIGDKDGKIIETVRGAGYRLTIS
ncbi:MAG TPA: helix-turn-helix domain-containing protein, partial [Defluviitoga sp.]|nr:helix-turn-helix domain-containing protein [Defluviitoga sp.]